MRYLLIIFLVLISFYLPQDFVSAQGSFTGDDVNGSLTGDEEQGSLTGSGGSSAELTNPLDSTISTIPDFFRVLVEIILVFAIPFIVFFIIYAGFLYVTAQGNPEKIQKAHAALLYALIGGMLILGANVLLTIITNTVTQIK